MRELQFCSESDLPISNEGTEKLRQNQDGGMCDITNIL